VERSIPAPMFKTSPDPKLRGMNYLLYIGYAALVIFAIYRQFASQQVSRRTLLLIPALLAFGTLQTLGKATLGPVDVLLLGVNASIGLGMGLWRGQTYRLWAAADGSAWQRGTLLTAINWLVLIGIRVGFGVVAHFAGIANSQMIGEMLASLFVTFAAQSLIIWLRSQSARGLLVAS
jgi:hypothetical protein